MSDDIIIRKATSDDLEKIWNMNISDHIGDIRWVNWKKEYIGYNEKNMAHTFVTVIGGKPVGEVTLIFSPECKAVSGNLLLADGKNVANVNALRIRKEYEGKGYVSKMMAKAEGYAKSLGYSKLTIGVDAKETRNLAIYLHWNYNEFIFSEIDEGELVLYYQKNI